MCSSDLFRATEDINSVKHCHSLILLNALNKSNSILGERTDVLLLESIESHAVVASLVTVLLVEVLAKVLENLGASTVGVVHAVLHDETNIRPIRFLLSLSSFSVVDEAVDELRVAVRKVEDADGRLAVATCSTGLLRREVSSVAGNESGASTTNLIIGLETLRERVVDDIANIGLVDSHSEPATSSSASTLRRDERRNSRDSGADDMEGPVLPARLDARAVVLVHPLSPTASARLPPTAPSRTHRMIVPRLNFVFPPQLVRRVLALLLGLAVDDPALATVLSRDKARNVLEDFLLLRPDFIPEVRAIERLSKHEQVAHSEVVDHVRLDSVVGGGGEGAERDAGEVLLERAHLLVVRACGRP